MVKKNPLQLNQALGHLATDKRLDILRRIGMVGSISEAARGAQVSYKAAWQAIETLSNLAGTALVEKAVGGNGGGGARLTQAGEQLLDAARLLDEARDAVLGQLAHQRGATVALPGATSLALRTSMRNQLPCIVRRVKAQAGAVNVELVLAADQSLTARITRESAQLLGLQAGLAVLALFKATAVQMASHIDAAPQRNLLGGRVSRVSRSLAGSELSLRLANDLQLVGFAAAGHGLRKGAAAFGAVDAASVVIALPG
jgi:molybdate transport system regulatory protein